MSLRPASWFAAGLLCFLWLDVDVADAQQPVVYPPGAAVGGSVSVGGPPPVIVSPPPPMVITQPQPVPVYVNPQPGPVMSQSEPQPYYGYDGGYYPRRVWGIGTVFGAGVTGGTIGTAIAAPIQPDTALTSSASPSILLPTLELSFFVRRGHSIEISIPLINVAVISAQVGAFYWNTDFFYNFNIGHGRVRLLLGPGLGYNILVGGGFHMGGIRIPGEIGVEFLTRSHRFGFKIMGRPWLEFDFGTNGNSSGSAVGGGALALLGFSFYGVR